MASTDGVAGPTPTYYRDWPNDAGFLATEQRLQPVELAVQGSIPSQVAGTFLRTGPGTFRVDGSKFEWKHLFDGFTHLHKFQLLAQPDGTCKVLYSSRRQTDALMEKARKTGTLDEVSFGQKRDPCATLFHKLKTVFFPSPETGPEFTNAGVTVHGDLPSASDGGTGPARSLTCRTDASIIKKIDLETLQPYGVTRQTSLHPDLKGPLSSAHAEYDAVTGDFYNFNLEFGRYATYRVFHTSLSTGETEILATITGPQIKPAYIHSFFLTEDYVILCIWPALFGAGGAQILWKRSLVDAIGFHPELQSRWCVVDRRQGRGLVATFLSPAFFSFHTVNSWQEEGADGSTDIFCDIVQLPNSDILQVLQYDNLLSTGPGAGNHGGSWGTTLQRYRLASIPKTGKMDAATDADLPRAETVVSIDNEAVGDLPTFNPRFHTKKSRYVYNVTNRGLSSFQDGLSKIDTDTKDIKIWSVAKHTPGEAIFIPDAHNEQEDAGFLLSVVLNGETGSSYLLCLDARDMTEVGRAECGLAVGFGFHGTHIPPTP